MLAEGAVLLSEPEEEQEVNQCEVQSSQRSMAWRSLGVLATATLVMVAIGISATKEAPLEKAGAELEHAVSLASTSQADCCLNWKEECFSTAGSYNNNHACKDCGTEPCIHICSGDPSSLACELCCQRFPSHDTPWNCAGTFDPGEPDPKMSDWVDDFLCDHVTQCYMQSYAQMTDDECRNWCKSWGLPGCCQLVGECDFIWGENVTTKPHSTDNPRAMLIQVDASHDNTGCQETQQVSSSDQLFTAMGTGTCCKRDASVTDIAEPSFVTVSTASCDQCRINCATSSSCQAFECGEQDRCEIHTSSISSLHCSPAITGLRLMDFECHRKIT